VADNFSNDKGTVHKMETKMDQKDMDKFGVRKKKSISDPTHYREVCWDLDQRGGVGETVMHLCMLSATSIHADLAKRLLKFYPKLILDIYLDEEYYGLHT
jgi:hypothetical protein